ncbi:MAG: MerR family transcriptional regulator [Phycisphaerae bacterium]|jgi:hypothetical protein|nr:MerR family transcriptional regulator [Phycisphaerae bacterium]
MDTLLSENHALTPQDRSSGQTGQGPNAGGNRGQVSDQGAGSTGKQGDASPKAAADFGFDGDKAPVDGSFTVGVRGPFVRPASRPIPPKLYRIGEVVEYSGLSRQTIHNYTTMGLLSECRWTPGGHRLYDESAFERLNKIVELRAQRKSLAYIRKYFARLDAVV